MIRTGTSISQGHIKGGLFGKIRNVFGGGEYLEASYSVGNRNGTAIQGRFTTPINGNPFRLFDLNVFQDSNDFTQSSSYREVARGINLSLKKIGIGKNHEFNYTYSWRNICDLGNKASQSLHPEPSGGHLFKLFTEYAGFGGVNFHKTQLDSALELPLGRGWYVDLIARGGLAIPIRNSKIGISDRFFLGGSTSLRGYQYRGVGPMDHKDSLGGNIFGALSLTLLGPVPSVETKRLKSQLWINGGQLALWENSKLFFSRQFFYVTHYSLFLIHLVLVPCGIGSLIFYKKC
ncbi:SAM50-like protein [Zancudomyces culisetae]|uniref:SAM50-like protein n=1 Tax=Zancudomyces culisetae TaxID=1213189 RepID=A0A1R1PG28_ZANCU|nr:SAM50-like protein [Zancudomyces culisetae]|eukprot:OMH79940.1 SAM50-like protein [Zancudomyces culisetae]